MGKELEVGTIRFGGDGERMWWWGVRGCAFEGDEVLCTGRGTVNMSCWRLLDVAGVGDWVELVMPGLSTESNREPWAEWGAEREITMGVTGAYH